MNPELKLEEITIETTGPQSDLARFKEGKEQLTAEQKDWIRGVFDAAGTISASLKKKDGKVFAVVPRISLAKPTMVIEVVQDLVGGYTTPRGNDRLEWYCEGTQDERIRGMIVLRRVLDILTVNQARNEHLELFRQVIDYFGNLEKQIEIAAALSQLNSKPKPEQEVVGDLSYAYVAGMLAVSGNVRHDPGSVNRITCHIPTAKLAVKLVSQFGGKFNIVDSAGDVYQLYEKGVLVQRTRNRMNAQWSMGKKDNAGNFLQNLKSKIPNDFSALIG